MNIHYRIIKVDPAAHGITVRYFTDNVTEIDLANSLNADGSAILNADGYPISTRTDVMISVYQTPTPSNEEIEKLIMLNAPVQWLSLQESIADANVDTKMRSARNLTGAAKEFTLEELDDLRKELSAKAKEASGNERAAHTVVELMDSLRVLTEENPQLVVGFVQLLEELKKVGG
mgnify:CR=1 FL=1